MKLTIIYPVDLFGPKVGGGVSFIKGIIKNAPSDIDIEFIGLTSDPCVPLKRWRDVKLGDKEFKLFPILFEKDENKRSIIPLALRFTIALQGCRLNYSGRVLFFNRIEPAVFFRDVHSPKILMVHSDIERQVKHKGNEVLWSRIPWFYFQLERYIFGFMDQVYTVSLNSLVFYKKEYPHLQDRISFLPTWVDDSIFNSTDVPKKAIRKELGFTEEAIMGRWVIFVGRLQEAKAPMLFIDTFKFYSQKDPGSRLIIIGEGNMQMDIENAVDRLGLRQQVTFVKSLKQEALLKFYQAADALLLTSHYEGMPMCVLEALGCGLPVVSTDVGEIRRIVKDGYSGEVVEEFNPDDIEQALGKVLDNPKVYTRENCLQSVKLYTPLQVLKPVYEKIKEII